MSEIILSDAEIGRLEEAGQQLSPGYRLYDEDIFQAALEEAKYALRSDSDQFEDLEGKFSLSLFMRKVLTDPAREGYGAPFPMWWCAFDYRLFEIEQDPWSEVKWWVWEELRGMRKNHTMHGCQNSAKTSWAGRFGASCMVLWFDNCKIYVSAPFKNAGDDKIWGESLKPALQKIQNPNNKFAEGLAVTIDLQTEDYFAKCNRTGGIAKARFIALENAAQAQGKKAIFHGGKGMVGVTLLMVDEFIENPSIKLAQVEANYSSNGNYFGLLMCNPMPQKVQHPALLRFSNPNKIDSRLLNKQRNFRWETSYGICTRYAWQNCPNNIVGKTVWEYLLNIEMQIAAREKADELVAAQIDAWAWSSSGSSYLDMAAVTMAGTFAEHVWEGERTRVMHIDCAFGGSDPATATILEAGELVIPNQWDKPIRKKILAGVSQLILPVTGDFEFTREWFEDMHDLFDYSGGSFPDTLQTAPFTIGQTIPAAWSLAEQTLKVARDNAIPRGNITFDASQRADCVEIMKWALGRNNVRWYYEGSRNIRIEEELIPDWFVWPPEYDKRDGDNRPVPKKYSDICNKPISMIWMFACNFIRNGHLINGQAVSRGIDELIARPIEFGKRANGDSHKRDVMSKEKLIDLGQKSPTWGEGLATGIYFAVRFLGLCPINRPELSVTVNAGSSPLGLIRAGTSRKFNLGREFFGAR